MSNSLRCVIDANIAIKRFIVDPFTAKVNQLLDYTSSSETEIYIPDLFYIETANIFWKYVRAGLYTAPEVQLDLATLKALPLKVVSTAELMAQAVEIGLNYNITAYDAAYVALAEIVTAPLLTLDRKLVTALASSSYNVRLFSDFELPPSGDRQT